MEDVQDFSLGGKEAVTEANLRDEYYWKLVADFIGPQSGEGLELESAPCKNRLLIQVGLLTEDNNFPWIAIVSWLMKIFPSHWSTNFRCLVERGIATTLSLGSDARQIFLDSDVNFNFVGPICDSIGVERQHLLEIRDFSERAQSIEVTNGLILELSNFVSREKLAPVVIVTWLRNFNPEFCKKGDFQKAYKVLRPKIKKLKLHYRNYETRSHRRNAAMENLLQSPFELVRKKMPKVTVKKRMRKDDTIHLEKVIIKEEYESHEITEGEESNLRRDVKKIIVKEDASLNDDSDEDLDESNDGEETSDNKEDTSTLLDIAMLSVQKLSKMYGGKTEACKQVCLDLLKNQYALTCKEHRAMAEFEQKLDTLCGEPSLVYPVVFLNYNANFLVDLQDAVEQQIMAFEKEIILSTGEKLGRDRLSKFKSFVNLSESTTSRYIHMACDILNTTNPYMNNYRKHWVAFCEEKKNPSRIAVNPSKRFQNYFEAAAGLIHHHKETALFFSDLLAMTNDTNIILESVAADANDSVIQSFVCVLAIVYCKVLGPYWQLLNSSGDYSLFCQYILSLYQKFLDWSKDPSTLLEPEAETNVFLQYPSQEKIFDGVFHFCGQWHTNRDLIRACLKRIVKVIAAVTEEHLKDFLPGGTFGQIPSPDLISQLESCTFSALMAKYPFSTAEESPIKKKKPDKSYKRSSQKNLQEDDDQSGSSDSSSDESSSWQRSGQNDADSPKIKKVRKVQEERVENNDRDYIVAKVKRNGGPCKTQQDVDKMMLRFDGKTREEKREGIRCEIMYQKMVLDNTDQNLGGTFSNTTQMVLKLKLALPRVKPGYSLVWAPKRTNTKPVVQPNAATGWDVATANENLNGV
ncbi:uncharacterized protein [Notothenia coriiceps]|uniref:Uncharacterized protein LOC104956382 n=1 Tax=Notothenia coriiceps TaxID=8208 RepID=A0A6I9P7F5_9TELE|nr:PREDICTED: uncharacterized protein LOC104956382 [Notothenia coriiceps]XP_010782166.1 PREDICTED: uncharacterized protein LOC104956382 [Notothenia coriiceps]